MYYQEKLINGVLMWRGAPDGAWQQVSIERMSERLVEAEATILALENKLEDIRIDGDC